MSVAPDRYTSVARMGYRSAGTRLIVASNERKQLAARRQKRLRWLLEAPASTTHENHCCRDKPRDRLRRPRPMSLAWNRATRWDWPF